MKLIVGLLITLLGLHSCEADRAFEDGDYRAAMEEYRLAAADGGSAEAWFNLALASLHQGAMDEAEVAAERSAVEGGASFRARRDFLIGLVLSRRFAGAELLASLPEAGAPEMDRALELASNAIWSFEEAVIATGSSPRASRNIERLWSRVRRLEGLRDQRRKREGKGSQGKTLQPKPRQAAPKRTEKPARFNEQRLGQAELLKLRARLLALEQRKLDLRRAVYESRAAAGGQDW